MREKALAKVRATCAKASGVGGGPSATIEADNTCFIRFYQRGSEGCLADVPRKPDHPEFWRLLAGYLTSNVRALREQAGWTQAETAERAGIDPKHMQAIESGSGNVTLRTLAALASAFEVDPARLLQPAPFASPRRRGRPPKRPPLEYVRVPDVSQLHDSAASKAPTTRDLGPKRPS